MPATWPFGVQRHRRDPVARPVREEDLVVVVLGQLRPRRPSPRRSGRSGRRSPCGPGPPGWPSARSPTGSRPGTASTATRASPSAPAAPCPGRCSTPSRWPGRRRSRTSRPTGRSGTASRVYGLVVGDAVGPAVVARRADLVDLVVAARAAVHVLGVRVRPDLAVVDPAGLLVDRDPERVAVAHRVDLGPRLVAEVGRPRRRGCPPGPCRCCSRPACHPGSRAAGCAGSCRAGRSCCPRCGARRRRGWRPRPDCPARWCAAGRRSGCSPATRRAACRRPWR